MKKREAKNVRTCCSSQGCDALSSSSSSLKMPIVCDTDCIFGLPGAPAAVKEEQKGRECDIGAGRWESLSLSLAHTWPPPPPPPPPLYTESGLSPPRPPPRPMPLGATRDAYYSFPTILHSRVVRSRSRIERAPLKSS